MGWRARNAEGGIDVTPNAAFFQHVCCHSGVKTYNSRMHLALSSTRQQMCSSWLQMKFRWNFPNTYRKKTSHWAEHAKPSGGGEISRQLHSVALVKKAKFINARKFNFPKSMGVILKHTTTENYPQGLVMAFFSLVYSGRWRNTLYFKNLSRFAELPWHLGRNCFAIGYLSYSLDSIV